MTAYIKETIPTYLVYYFLDREWDSKDGQVPKPKIMEANTIPDNPFEIPLNLRPAVSDLIVIRPDPAGERETIRDLGATMKDVTFDVDVDLHSTHSRQRLYDMKAEVRRILHRRMHDFNNIDGMEGFQVVWYRSFVDYAQQNLKYWSGIIRIQCISNKVVLDV